MPPDCQPSVRMVAVGVRSNSLLRGLYACKWSSLRSKYNQKVVELTSAFDTQTQYIVNALPSVNIDKILDLGNESGFPGEVCTPPAGVEFDYSALPRQIG